MSSALLAERRRKRAQREAAAAAAEEAAGETRRPTLADYGVDDTAAVTLGVADDADSAAVYVPLKQRRQQQEASMRAVKRRRGDEERTVAEAAEAASAAAAAQSARAREQQLADEDAARERERTKSSLFDISMAIKSAPDYVEETAEQKEERQEAELLENLTADRAALVGAKANATGLVFTERMRTSWRPPRHIRNMSDKEATRLREKWHIVVEGDDIPPPTVRFEDMRLAPAIIDWMTSRAFKRPTPIQIQGIPVALSGRDMIGIAFTGSGKTLCFSLPMVMFALDAETRRPLVRGEGVCGMIINPSRELAEQTCTVVRQFCTALTERQQPELRCVLCIGQLDMREQNDLFNKGVHMVVATPGRLLDFLTKGKLNCDICKYLCLDEADRLIDLGFEEAIRAIFDKFKYQRQTVLFSATMPTKIQEFALSALVDPIVVNVGRAGATNLDVIQEVEYVKQEAKVVYLLECLQKTAPPVLVFASKSGDVDDIHEYLLLKGVDAVAIHGGKDQKDRLAAVNAFKDGSKDVLVASDIASKGLDFPDVQHVINYDMPKEIEDYVHRIGRTGRCGKTGVATTFINRECDEMVLLDLKYILMEAKQKVPPVLMTLDDPNEGDTRGAGAVRRPGQASGCAYCGGLGHRTLKCPKLLTVNASKIKNTYGYDDMGGGEM